MWPVLRSISFYAENGRLNAILRQSRFLIWIMAMPCNGWWKTLGDDESLFSISQKCLPTRRASALAMIQIFSFKEIFPCYLWFLCEISKYFKR